MLNKHSSSYFYVTPGRILLTCRTRLLQQRYKDSYQFYGLGKYRTVPGHSSRHCIEDHLILPSVIDHIQM